MRMPSAALCVLSLAVCPPVQADGPLDGELGFCETISTPMPDPAGPGFYRSLPTNAGMIAGAGWSGHVKAWFASMRDRDLGAVPQYLAHEERLSSAAAAYRAVVVDEGGRVLREMQKATFGKSVRDLNARTGSSSVARLVNQYANESDLAARGYDGLRQAVLELEASRKDLLAVRDDYEGFLAEMHYRTLAREKQKLLDDAAEVSQAVSSVISSLANASAAIPFDAISIVKGLKGDPVAAIVKAAFGPDPARLGELDARLRALDEALPEHRERGFTNRIAAARLRLEKARSVSDGAAGTILAHKTRSWQALHELAGLEAEGQGYQFFHLLRDYYRAVAYRGASLNEAVNAYYQWLTATRLSEGEMLARHIDDDVDHVRTYGLDPSGQWTRLASEPAAWLRRDYLPWHRGEVQRVASCMMGFKQLRHLLLVNQAVNRAVEATGGIAKADLGKYLF